MLQYLLNFMHTNKALVGLLAHMAMSSVVAVTPKSYQDKPFLGLLLKALHFQSSLPHFDEPGSLQIPMIRKVLGVGRKLLDAAEHSLPATKDSPK